MITIQTLTAMERYQLDILSKEIQDFPRDRGQILPILRKFQNTIGYLPQEAITVVADFLSISLSEVYGIASFYNQFRFTPPGRNQVKVCMGTACHVRGGEIILENFERKLGVQDGETTVDREFSIERVACVGCCALAPVVLVGEETLARMTPSKVEGVVVKNEIAREQRNSVKKMEEA